jgi:hypothetical protein
MDQIFRTCISAPPTSSDKILGGAKPADIPVRQPSKFDFIVNLTTAKALHRREFITLLGGAAAAWPLSARGQQPGRFARIGLLFPGTETVATARIAAFREGLRAVGAGRALSHFEEAYRLKKHTGASRPLL